MLLGGGGGGGGGPGSEASSRLPFSGVGGSLGTRLVPGSKGPICKD